MLRQGFSKGKDQPAKPMQDAAAKSGMAKAPVKPPRAAKGANSAFNNAPKGDNRTGRMQDVKTDRGNFRFKSNTKEG